MCCVRDGCLETEGKSLKKVHQPFSLSLNPLKSDPRRGSEMKEGGKEIYSFCLMVSPFRKIQQLQIDLCTSSYKVQFASFA